MPCLIFPSHKKLRAALSLEAALVMPLILTLLIFLLSASLHQVYEIQWRFAAEQTAEELALLFPAAEKLLSSAGENNPTADKILRHILDPEDRSILESLAGDYASSLFLSPFIQKRIDYWLAEKRKSGSWPVRAHRRQVMLHWHRSGRCLILEVTAGARLLFKHAERTFSVPVPLWGDYIPENKEQTEKDKREDSIWEADNFTRGRYFREKYGGDLPFNYPVIAYWKDGTAGTVKSMDLTAPRYEDPEKAVKTVHEYLQKLADFSGFQSKSEKLPSIEAGEILSRELILVVPENAPAIYDEEFRQRIETLAEKKGIILRYEKAGRSFRYGKE